MESGLPSIARAGNGSYEYSTPTPHEERHSDFLAPSNYFVFCTWSLLLRSKVPGSGMRFLVSSIEGSVTMPILAVSCGESTSTDVKEQQSPQRS